MIQIKIIYIYLKVLKSKDTILAKRSWKRRSGNRRRNGLKGRVEKRGKMGSEERERERERDEEGAVKLTESEFTVSN